MYFFGVASVPVFNSFNKREMVAFGKKLKERQIQEWQGYYINYKLMKKKVRQYAQQIEVGTQDRRHVLKDFSRMLDNQIEKIVLFLLEQQGLLSSRIAKLNELQQPDISEIFQFTDYYVKTRANHPYSQLQQVFKHVGLGAVVGAISRNLHELQEHQGSYLSIFDHPALPFQDPVVDSMKAAVDRLSHSTNFLNFLAQHALIMQEELPTSEEPVDDQRYHFMSLLLNLANTFLYMVNTYIIVPTADDYSMSLGAAATVCGIVIGSMAVAQVFSSVYFSAWSNKSYFKPLVFSSIVLFIGNAMYALAYDFNSLSILLIGRLFCGLGSARAVNRRYISDCVPLKLRMKASAGFVSASALGMAFGPALGGLLQTNFKLYKLTFNQETLPGWVMSLAWLIYLVWLWISFREPYRDTEKSNTAQESTAEPVENDALERGKQPLLLKSEDKQETEDGDGEFDGSDEALKESRGPATSIGSAYRLLTPSVKVQLLIYFMLKYAMEVLLSESSVVTTYYFGWSTSSVAIFLACLGITVLPVNIVVGSYISNMFEDRQILLASEIMVCIGILLSFHVVTYTVPQYVCSGLIMFVSAEVLEGVNLSLLSRVMSSRLSRGTYNGGLLSTEAGTLARVVADGTITLAGYLGEMLRIEAENHRFDALWP
ncbi:hypothetical protein OIU77_027154 [Salix suchowensis]|uniref:SPX domain-containing protein n=1 Tax=Salix suchowensis TaxID=1278906 RepID=A0ABQ9BP26_9ROSI|nr:hypothetical protein OIU77_027154 [Salix suchowensis]